MQGTIFQAGQQLKLRLATTAPMALDLTFSTGPSAVEIIELPAGSYIRANAAFWRSQAGAGAGRLADHWIQVPPSHAHALGSSLGPFAPDTLSRCLVEDHGTLSLAGRATVAGQPAILIKDAGNLPGSSPSVMAVAASGPPYPLRYSASRGQRPGGRIDVCNDGKADGAYGTLTFGQFGSAPSIQAPRGVLRSLSTGPAA